MTGWNCSLFAQDQSSQVLISGYLKDLQTVVALENSDLWLCNNLIHNRVDAQWFPIGWLKTQVSIRNRFIYGDFVQLFPDYARILNQDNGYWHWSRVWSNRPSYILHSVMDRAFLEMNDNNWLIRIGRQRINWGMDVVWNPNDIFNNFSYFDFDYEERPGSDAVSLQYYTGVASTVQWVYKQGRLPDESTWAGLYRFNHWGYDVQFFCGKMVRDWVAGAGWAGQISGAAFRGEATCFMPEKNTQTRQKILMLSTSADYTFHSGFFMQASLLYNSAGATGKAGSWDLFADPILTAKDLSRGRYELFGKILYPFSPLINGDFSAILNPLDRSYYMGPSMTFSLNNNIDLLILAQLFHGEPATEFGGIGRVFYSRLKFSF